jgi:hypothetical protein
MGLFDMIFGSSPANQAMNSYLGNPQSGIANSNTQYTQNQLANAYNQQMMNQYQMMRNKPKWMYAGIECNAKEFAKLMWPDNPEEQMMFILKHGEE